MMEIIDSTITACWIAITWYLFYSRDAVESHTQAQFMFETVIGIFAIYLGIHGCRSLFTADKIKKVIYVVCCLVTNVAAINYLTNTILSRQSILLFMLFNIMVLCGVASKLVSFVSGNEEDERMSNCLLRDLSPPVSHHFYYLVTYLVIGQQYIRMINPIPLAGSILGTMSPTTVWLMCTAPSIIIELGVFHSYLNE